MVRGSRVPFCICLALALHFSQGPKPWIKCEIGQITSDGSLQIDSMQQQWKCTVPVAVNAKQTIFSRAWLVLSCSGFSNFAREVRFERVENTLLRIRRKLQGCPEVFLFCQFSCQTCMFETEKTAPPPDWRNRNKQKGNATKQNIFLY